jgi:predicted RNA binding protein YcfA (HicA-like mRNA interferase family)
VKAVSGKDFCRAIEKRGWVRRRVTGSHHIYAQPGNPVILSVPIHGNKSLKKGTLRTLLNNAGMTEDDL